MNLNVTFGFRDRLQEQLDAFVQEHWNRER